MFAVLGTQVQGLSRGSQCADKKNSTKSDNIFWTNRAVRERELEVSLSINTLVQSESDKLHGFDFHDISSSDKHKAKTFMEY